MSEMLSKYQAIVITGYTGIVMCDFSVFHADVESRFGRSVWTHEFGNEDFTEEVKDMYKDEFMYLCNMKRAE